MGSSELTWPWRLIRTPGEELRCLIGKVKAMPCKERWFTFSQVRQVSKSSLTSFLPANLCVASTTPCSFHLSTCLPCLHPALLVSPLLSLLLVCLVIVPPTPTCLWKVLHTLSIVSTPNCSCVLPVLFSVVLFVFTCRYCCYCSSLSLTCLWKVVHTLPGASFTKDLLFLSYLCCFLLFSSCLPVCGRWVWFHLVFTCLISVLEYTLGILICSFPSMSVCYCYFWLSVHVYKRWFIWSLLSVYTCILIIATLTCPYLPHLSFTLTSPWQ